VVACHLWSEWKLHVYITLESGNFEPKRITWIQCWDQEILGDEQQLVDWAVGPGWHLCRLLLTRSITGSELDVSPVFVRLGRVAMFQDCSFTALMADHQPSAAG
jgi:hypothetical protein